MIRNTSKQAFAAIDLPACRAAVYRQLHKRPKFGYTRAELAEAIGWPINCVTGRVCELLQAGLIVEDGKRPSLPGGRTAAILKVAK